MKKRLAQVRAFEIELKNRLQTRGGVWVSAKALAAEMGMCWQPVAKTLMRLAASHDIDCQEVDLVAEKKRVRRSHLYRVWPTNHVYPSWLHPQPHHVRHSGAARVVRGRASLENKK